MLPVHEFMQQPAGREHSNPPRLTDPGQLTIGNVSGMLASDLLRRIWLVACAPVEASAARAPVRFIRCLVHNLPPKAY